tara:strand:- start:215 stop:916 length:702 start_codon:yes stop_codon:yes gene_type:complete
MPTTEERMETLETQVRRQRRWNIALGVVVVVGGLMAAKGIQVVPDVIQAKKFEVVNDAGKVIVELSNVQGGGVDNGKLVTRNSTGGTLVTLIAGPDGGVVETHNGKGQTLVAISATTEGEGSVTTKNGKGQTLVKLSAGPEGGFVETQNGKGQALVTLSATTDGKAVVETQNGKGQALVLLGSTPMGGRVMCTNAIGKPVVLVMASPIDGSGLVMTLDPSGKEPTSVTPTPEP